MSTPSRLVLATLLLCLYVALPWRWATGTEARDLRAAHADDRSRQAINARIVDARRVAKDPAGWRDRIRNVAAAFPPTVDVGGALAQLRAAAAGAGVELASVSASPSPAPDNATTPVQIEMRVTGPAAAVEQFLIALRGIPRLLTTSAVSVTTAATSVTIQLTSQLWTLPGTVPHL